MRNINLKGHLSWGTGVINFDPANGLWSANPILSTDYGLYVNSSGSLVFSSLGTTTVLGGSTPGGVPTWEQIFANDQTFNVAGTTFTVDNSTGNNDVLTLTNSGAGSGDVIQITNVGTGKDINGSSSLWSVSKAGAAVLVSVDVPTIATTGAMTIGSSGASLITIGTNSNTITMAKATTFSSTITVTDGLTDLISTSNAAAALRVTNNTATTWGAGGASAGIAILRSTSLTTGDLLRLQLTEANLTTGNYINLYDATGTASVFKVAKAGLTTIAGPSGGGASAFVVTAGDLVVSDGSLAITDADNAATFSITNNTATTASVVIIAGSGVFSGSTTTSFMTITPSGLTTGTGIYAPMAALTSGIAINVPLNALTTGQGLILSHTTSTIADGGSMLRITSTSADTGGATNGTLLDVGSTSQVAGTVVKMLGGAMTTGVLLALTTTTGMTSGSVIRATTSTAGAIATNGVFSFNASGIFTNGASTVGAFHVAGAATVAGTIMSILGGAQTTGIALNITDPSTGMTSGSLLRVISATAGAVATNGIVSFQSSGVFTSTTIGFVNVIVSGAVAGTGMAIQMSATSQTTGIGFRIDQTNTTTGYSGALAQFTGSHTTGGTTLSIVDVTTTTGDAVLVTSNALVAGTSTAMRIAHTTSVLGAGNSLLRLSSTSVDTGTTTGTLLDLSSTGGTTATLALITGSALTSGNGFVMNLNALTTGIGFSVAHTTSVLASGGSLVRISSTSVDTGTTNGVLLDLSSTGGTSSTQVLGTFSALNTGIGVSLVAASLSTGQLVSLSSTGTAITTGSLLVATTGTTSALATNGVISIRATGAYTSTSNAGLLDVAASATVSGTIVNIAGNALTTGVALNVTGTGVYTGTGFITVTQSGATTGVVAQITTAGLTTGSALAITSAALTTGQGILVTDSSADTGAHAAIFAKVTNTAAIVAAPLKTSNVALNNSKFTKILVSTDGSKTFTLWLSTDQTTPNGTLTGAAGDVCVNGPSGRTFWNNNGTTGWTASNA